MEEKTTAGTQKNGSVLIPSIVAVLAAIVLCASYFMPFTCVKDESIVSSEYAQSYEISEGSGVTLSDVASPSLAGWARIYKAYSDSISDLTSNHMDSYQFLFRLIVASGVLAVAALLFAALRKATPTVLFALANLGLNAFLCFYFEESGPVSSSAMSEWAFGRNVVLGAAGVLAIAGIWLFVAKHIVKRSEAAA